MYQKYDKRPPVRKVFTRQLVKIINSGQNINWDEGWFNVLEPVTGQLCPEIFLIKDLLNDFGVRFCLMTGSGPTIFAVLRKKSQGKHIIKQWPRSTDSLFLTGTIKRY